MLTVLATGYDYPYVSHESHPYGVRNIFHLPFQGTQIPITAILTSVVPCLMLSQVVTTNEEVWKISILGNNEVCLNSKV